MPVLTEYNPEQIREALPHKDPYVMMDHIRVVTDDEGVLVRTVGKVESTQPRGGKDFWTVLRSGSGPYEGIESGIYVASGEWAGFDGHFQDSPTVPGAETLELFKRHMQERAGNEDRVTISGLTKVRFPHGVGPTDIVRVEEVFEPGRDVTASGNVYDLDGKSVAEVTGMTIRKAALDTVTTGHILECAAQTAAVAALRHTKLAGSGKLPMLSGVEGVLFLSEVGVGDGIEIRVHVGRVSLLGGHASADVCRVSGGVSTQIGTIGKMSFVAIDPANLA